MGVVEVSTHDSLFQRNPLGESDSGGVGADQRNGRRSADGSFRLSPQAVSHSSILRTAYRGCGRKSKCITAKGASSYSLDALVPCREGTTSTVDKSNDFRRKDSTFSPTAKVDCSSKKRK